MPWQPLPDIDPAPPLRKQNGGYGTLGRNISLTSNHFQVNFKSYNVTLFHYDVVIKDYKNEEGLPKSKKMDIFERMKRSHRKTFEKHPIAYDKEKSAYSVGSIPGITKTGTEFDVDLEVEGRTSRFKVTLKEVARANLQELMRAMRYDPNAQQKMPSHIYQMLEILFRHYRSVKYVQVGQRCFFPKEPEFGRNVDLTMGKQGVVGFFSSLRPAAWKNGSVLLNIDVSNTAFYKEQPVLQFVKEVLQLRDDDLFYPLGKDREKALNKEIKGLKVRVTHSQIPRTYRVNKVMPLGAAKQKFCFENKETKETKQISVKEYFQHSYKKEIRYDELNLLHCGPQNKEIYLSMEYLIIEKGQKVQKKLSPNELRSFIQSTAVPPAERLKRIKQIAQKNKFEEDPLLRALQANVEGAPLCVQGKVLPPVNLKMKEDKVTPRFGVWDARNKKFDTAAVVDPWAVINYAGPRTREETVWNFITKLTQMGKEMGMTIGKPSYGAKKPNDPSRDLRKLKENNPALKIVLVIIGNSESIYAQVKKAGDVEIGLMTQCVKQINVYKCAPATIGNILLKINAKVGGTNNSIDPSSKPVVLTEPVIFLGADVNHPASRDYSTPSLAAVVGSMDRFASQYEVQVRSQECRQEVIVDLEGMTKMLLKTFYQRTQFKPKRIIMYRDGVSESQFVQVLSYELKAIRKACTSLEKSYEPAITFIVVQKRHHTRLFCDERDGVGKSKNIPPGTTVDRGITHPYENDFFLCSHQGIQGTSKPSHYHVLWDDSDMTADQLHLMTYAMCHLYSRCTRSVSIPTPAYYAHLAAFRAKVHLTDLIHSDSGSLASGGEAGHIPEAQIMRAIKIDESFPTKKKMYFL